MILTQREIASSILRELFELEGMIIYLIQLLDYPSLGIKIDSAFYAKNSFQIDQAIKAFFRWI